jgi:hypothetical protein
LQGVLRFGCIAEHSQGQGIERPAQAIVKFAESALVAAHNASERFAINCLLRSFWHSAQRT